MTFKNITFVIIGIAIIFIFGMPKSSLIHTKEFKHNQMINGCVMQESQGKWIRTCG